MKLPIYFEAFGSIGITVSFVNKTKNYHGTVTLLLAECPNEMRAVVLNNEEHFKTKNSGYKLVHDKYEIEKPIKD